MTRSSLQKNEGVLSSEPFQLAFEGDPLQRIRARTLEAYQERTETDIGGVRCDFPRVLSPILEKGIDRGYSSSTTIQSAERIGCLRTML